MKKQNYKLEHNCKLSAFGNDTLITVYCRIFGYYISLWLSNYDNENYYAVHNSEGEKINRSFSGNGGYQSAILYALALGNKLPANLTESFVDLTNKMLR